MAKNNKNNNNKNNSCHYLTCVPQVCVFCVSSSAFAATEMEGFGRFVKWTLFAVNFLIFVGGVAVLAVGSWTLADKAYIERLLRNELFISSAYILIFSGAVILVISFLGCFGALKEVKCMLLTYFILLSLMLVVLLIGGLLGFVFRYQVEDNLRPEMRHTIEEYDPDRPDSPITAAWDDTQTYLRCCGMNISSLDHKPWLAWKLNHRVNPEATQQRVPASCCNPDKNPDCALDDPVNPEDVWPRDCFAEGLRFVKGHAVYLFVVALVIAIAMILGIIFSFLLFIFIE